jgi:Family of unknown function (DUF5305)
MKNKKNLITRISKPNNIKTLMIICGVLLVLALIGMSVMLSKPAKVKQQTALVSYTQNGQFTYSTYLKPSYLYGPTPETTPGTAQYPLAVVKNIDFTYAFQPVAANTSGSAWVEADLGNPGIWQKTLELVPSTPTSGDFTLTFSLDMQQINQLFQEIETETGITSSSENVTLTAYFQTGPNVSVQNLPINIENHLIVIPDLLVLTQETGSGQFTYSINPVVPAAQTTTMQGTQTTTESYPSFNLMGQTSVTTADAPTVLQSGQTAFINLVDKMDVTFDYQFQATKPVNNLNTSVDIVATLAVPQSWSKNFDLLQTQKSGNFNLAFPLDIASYTQLMQSINSETKVSPQSYSLTVTANIHTTGETQFGPIDEIFSPTMSGTITGNVLSWNQHLTDNNAGAISQTSIVGNPNKYFGLSVSTTKTTFVILTCFLAFILFSLMALYFVHRGPAPSDFDREVKKIQKRYGARMAESTGDSFIEFQESMPMNSIEDLIKIADEMGKPVVHQSGGTSGDIQSYYVIDGNTRYRYSLSRKKSDHEGAAK